MSDEKLIAAVLRYYADAAEADGLNVDAVVSLARIAVDFNTAADGCWMTTAEAEMVANLLDIAADILRHRSKSILRIVQATDGNEGAMQA